MSVAACSEEDAAATNKTRKERIGRIMGEKSMIGSIIGGRGYDQMILLEV